MMFRSHGPLGPGMISEIKLWWTFFRGIRSSSDRDVIVVSYPKAGRTWHRVVLRKYLETAFTLKKTHSISSRELSRSLGIPVVSYSHNGAGSRYAIGPRHFLNASPVLWRNHKVILLVREPRDVLVSGYFHDRHRLGSFTGSLSEYIRHPYTGIEKLLVAHQRWSRYSRTVPAFLLQRYESFHGDIESSVTAMLDFLGIKVEASALSQAIEFARFENMRRLETEGYFKSDAMRVVGSEPDARKVREGRIGGYKEYMSEEDIAFVDRAIRRIGYPY